MKKIILFAAFCFASFAAFAIPAKPGWVKFTQPDGSVIEVRMVGDEFGHAILDRSGQVLRRDSKGYLRPSTEDVSAIMHKAAANRAEANARRMRSVRASQRIAGSPKIPVLLVAFKDQAFKDSKILYNHPEYGLSAYTDDPQTAFAKLLHQSGYSFNGGTGCVLDFYTDNSNGVYTPVFDVLPVVTLPSNMATYGANDSSDNDTAPELAVYQAVKALDSSVDFSQYDNDHDGNIDMILMYYAGLNEAEYGPEDSIWPHQWSVEYSSLRDGSTYIRNASFDGVRLRNYFCTSELSSVYENRVLKGVLCGIGTTCHEFAHSLGLPDFYDTDYEDNGSAGGTYNYDTMCSGPYNNNGNTPPFFGAEELIMLGWMDSLTDLPVVGNITIPALSKTDKVAYKGASSTTGEYFVFECRGSSSWDKYIPEGPGMLVYHVDKSDRKVKSNTAKKLWEEWGSTNAINAVGAHPCYYIIPAGCQNYNADNANTGGYNGNPTETTGLHYSGTDFTFGTSSKYSEYTPVDWNKAVMDYTLKNISYSSGSVSFSVGFDICYIVAPSMPSIGSTWTPELENAPAGSKVEWYLDDVKMVGTSFKLSGGKHLAEARVTASAKIIRVELEFEVK